MTWINKNTKNTSRAPQAVPNNRRNPQIFHLNYNFVFFIYLKRQNYEIATLTLNKKKKKELPDRTQYLCPMYHTHSLTLSLSFFLLLIQIPSTTQYLILQICSYQFKFIIFNFVHAKFLFWVNLDDSLQMV